MITDTFVRTYNRAAWDRKVATGNEWTLPVSTAETEEARRGEWSIVLTAVKRRAEMVIETGFQVGNGSPSPRPP